MDNQSKNYSSEIEKSPRKEVADILNKSNDVAEMINTNFIQYNFDDFASTDVSIQSHITEDTTEYDSFHDGKLATSLNLEKMDEVNVGADSDEYNFDDCSRVRAEIQGEILQDAESLDGKFYMQPDVLYQMEKFMNVHDFKTDRKFKDSLGIPVTEIKVNDIQTDLTDLLEEANQDAKSLDEKFLVQTEGLYQTDGPISQGNKLEVSCDTLSGDNIPVSEHHESQGENKFYANEFCAGDDSLYEAF